jgi:hypothetical protein
MKDKSVSFSVRDMDSPIIGKVADYGHGLLILSDARTREKHGQSPEKNVELGGIAVPIANIVGIIKVLRIRLGPPAEEEKIKK